MLLAIGRLELGIEYVLLILLWPYCPSLNRDLNLHPMHFASCWKTLLLLGKENHFYVLVSAF